MRARSSLLHPCAGTVAILSHGCPILCLTSSSCQRPGTLLSPCPAKDIPLLHAPGQGNAGGMSWARWGFASPTPCPGPVVVQPPRGHRSCLWHTQIPSSPCCPSHWRSVPSSWLQCARPSYLRGQRFGSLQGKSRDAEKCLRLRLCLQEEVTPGPEGPRVPAALLGPACGGQGGTPLPQSKSTPRWSQARFAFVPAEGEKG